MTDPLIRCFPHLATVDLWSTGTKLFAILGSLAFFSIVFVLSYFASSKFHTFKNVLSAKEKVFWCLAFVRGVFGIYSVVIGSYYMSFDDTLKKDVVNARTPLSAISIYFSSGFFTFECLALFTSNVIFRFFDKYLFIHHILSFLNSVVASYCNKAYFFAMFGLLLESTTPFTCLCWMLLKADLAHTLLWKLNQFVLVHLFHCRTMVEAYLMLISYYQWDTIWSDMPLPTFLCLYIQLPLLLFFLTPYWTYKKTLQLIVKPVDFNHPTAARDHVPNNGHVDVRTAAIDDNGYNGRKSHYE